ncbi:MAG: HEPN domain-containing protein [Candidatus Latescibacterota bacterium]
MDERDLAMEWFEIADKDLASAEFLKDMEPTPYDIICFHCQQSAEKYLKGYLALHGEETPKTHILQTLNGLCRAIDPDFADINEDCISLSDYAVFIRYPSQLEVDENLMLEALRRAYRIKQFVLKKVSRGSER